MSKTFNRGLTLIECCTTLTLASVLATTAVSSLSHLHERRRLEGLSAELSTDLHYVRTESVSRNQSLRLTIQSDSAGACYLIHTGSSSDCQCDSSGVAQCQAGAELIKARNLPAAQGIGLKANVGSIVIHPRLGTATPGGTLALTDTQGHEVRHVVSLTGRLRVCGVGGWNALPSC